MRGVLSRRTSSRVDHLDGILFTDRMLPRSFASDEVRSLVWVPATVFVSVVCSAAVCNTRCLDHSFICTPVVVVVVVVVVSGSTYRYHSRMYDIYASGTHTYLC